MRTKASIPSPAKQLDSLVSCDLSHAHAMTTPTYLREQIAGVEYWLIGCTDSRTLPCTLRKFRTSMDSTTRPPSKKCKSVTSLRLGVPVPMKARKVVHRCTCASTFVHVRACCCVHACVRVIAVGVVREPFAQQSGLASA